MTTNSALSASLRSSRLRRLLADVSVLAFAAVAFTGSPAWGESREKIVFTNTSLNIAEQVAQAEIYIMNPGGTEPIRLTSDGFADALPVLSPDGKGKIVFDSNRIAIFVGGTPFDSDLFLINHDGTADGPLQPTPLTRGSSASFGPTGNIAFHRSASGTYGTRIGVCPGNTCRSEPGGPTTDSDIFSVNLDDLIANVEPPRNLTNGLSSTPSVRGPFASDDPDWSPDGRWIAFTSRIPNVPLSQSFAGIYVAKLNMGQVTSVMRLTNSGIEERSPAWSPDGTRIAFMRRRSVEPEPVPPGARPPFEIWVLNLSVGETITVESETRLTDNTVPDLSPAWVPAGSIIGEKILFHSNRAPTYCSSGKVPPCAANDPPRLVPQIFVMNSHEDGTNQDERALTGAFAPPGALLTGQSLFPKWGRIAVGRDPAPQ